jgi:hypothetical protein
MRAPLCILLAAALLSSFAGCSSSDDSSSGSSGQNSNEQPGQGGAAGAGGQGGSAQAGAAGSGEAGKGGEGGSAQAGAAGSAQGGAAGAGEAGAAGSAGTGESPAASCATSFGTALPPGFLRVDGTLVAIVRPQDQQCALPNGTHVTLQVLVGGAVYRMVTNVVSDQGTDRRVRFGVLDAALPAPAWEEGFHTGVTLDYATDLGVHSQMAPFVPVEQSKLIAEIVNRLSINGHIAVYSQGTGGTSTHLVHRNGSNDDGAIVLDPESATPHFLLFHFLEQTF